MRKSTVIVFQQDPYNSVFEALFADILNDPDVYFVVERDYPQYGIYSYLPSRKLKKATLGLSSRLYLSYYHLPQLVRKLKKEYDHISVLIHNACLVKTEYPVELFKMLGDKVSFNLLYLDVHSHEWVCRYANYLYVKGVFDKVFTIDKEDAEKYGINYCYTPYSVKNDIEINIDKDLYFCGAEAGRLYKIVRIWQEAKKHNISLNFDLASCRDHKDFFEGDENVRFISHLPYKEVLQNTLNAECILDITQQDQSALTLRPYEAVAYNKKLLTDNKEILRFEYYNDKYIQYFDSVEKIDWDWINNGEAVDYGYSGEFSPIHLLENLA